MTLLQFHVIVSLIGIVSGLLVAYGLVTGRPLPAWTALFLVTTIATSATGFPLAPYGFDPPRALGIMSLVLLALALLALYGLRLAGPWRSIYVVTAVAALYFNVFVGIVQAFGKLAPLKALAPTQSEAPFVAAQLVALAAFVAIGWWAVRRFHPTPAANA
jgi:hypothetical protein